MRGDASDPDDQLADVTDLSLRDLDDVEETTLARAVRLALGPPARDAEVSAPPRARDPGSGSLSTRPPSITGDANASSVSKRSP